MTRMVIAAGMCLLCAVSAMADFRTFVDGSIIYDDNYLREDDGEDSFLFLPRIAESYVLDRYKGNIETKGTLSGYFFSANSDRNFFAYDHTLKSSLAITDYTRLGLDGHFVYSDNPQDADVYGDDTRWMTYIGADVTPSVRSNLFGERVIGSLGVTGDYRNYLDTGTDDWIKAHVNSEVEGVLGDKTSVLVAYRYSMANFKEAPDYDGHRAGVGMRRQFSDALGVKGMVGALTRSYDRPDPDTEVYNEAEDSRGGEGDATTSFWWEVGVDGNLGLGDFTNLEVNVYNEFEDSTYYTGEYYQTMGGDAVLRHELTDKTQIYLTLYYFNRDYQNQDRNDDHYGGKAVIRYLVLDWLGVSGGYSHEERVSNVDDQDYSSNRFWATADMTF